MPTVSLSSFCGLDRETRDSCTGGRDTEVTAKTRFSDFADGECGEPFTPHHLHLDFTPDTEVDTPLVQQKIIDFWDFVNSTPEIQHMLMKPDKCMSIVSAISEVKITSPSKTKLHKEEVLEMDHTAISSLGLFSKPGLITETPSKHTSLSRDSKENNLDIISPWILLDIHHGWNIASFKDKCGQTIVTSEHKRSVESGTSNPKSEETFSVFADGWCGEPLEPQHLTIDFTPNKETDTEFVQKKVCSFWEFIENSPELHKLRVKADGNIVLDTGSSSDSRKSVSKMKQSIDTMDHEFYEDEDEEESIPEKTAVEMLEFAENKNLINRIFGAKMASTCSLGPREYVQEDTKVPQPKKKDKKKKLACTCISSPKVSCPLHSSQIHVLNKKPSKVHGSKLKLLSRQLNDWDAKHPKNMDPPGHAPALQHCTIQRQVHHNLTCL